MGLVNMHTERAGLSTEQSMEAMSSNVLLSILSYPIINIIHEILSLQNWDALFISTILFVVLVVIIDNLNSANDIPSISFSALADILDESQNTSVS